MAKRNDLAALAALGAMGFMLKNKSDSDFQKNREDQTSKYKPTEDSNPTRGAGYNSTETRNAPVMDLKTPAQSIDAADVSSDANSMVSSGPSGTTTTGPAAPPDLNIQPAVKSTGVKPAANVQSNTLAPIVSQKQLADFQQRFGKDKTLRDYMNAQRASNNSPLNPVQLKKRGGTVKIASGGMTSSASRRGDGIATKGKTRGKIC
jgi:hypothetical protein